MSDQLWNGIALLFEVQTRRLLWRSIKPILLSSWGKRQKPTAFSNPSSSSFFHNLRHPRTESQTASFKALVLLSQPQQVSWFESLYKLCTIATKLAAVWSDKMRGWFFLYAQRMAFDCDARKATLHQSAGNNQRYLDKLSFSTDRRVFFTVPYMI